MKTIRELPTSACGDKAADYRPTEGSPSLCLELCLQYLFLTKPLNGLNLISQKKKRSKKKNSVRGWRLFIRLVSSGELWCGEGWWQIKVTNNII